MKPDSLEAKETKHPCSVCRHETNHDIVASESFVSDEPDFFEIKYMIVKCRGCDHYSFRMERSDYESYYQVSKDEWQLDKDVEVFPPIWRGTEAFRIAIFFRQESTAYTTKHFGLLRSAHTCWQELG